MKLIFSPLRKLKQALRSGCRKMNAIKQLLFFSVFFLSCGLTSHLECPATESGISSFQHVEPLYIPHLANPDFGLSDVEITERTEKSETSSGVGVADLEIRSNNRLADLAQVSLGYAHLTPSRLFILYHNLRN